MTTPNTNFDVNLTKGNSNTYTDLVELAATGREAVGDPLAWTYLHSTWDNVDQTHHLLASNVVNDVIVARFFNDLRDATIGAPGGAYVFDINDAGNLVTLPNTEQARAKSGRYASLHANYPAEHRAYDDFGKKALYEIDERYRTGLDLLGTPGYPADTPEARHVQMGSDTIC